MPSKTEYPSQQGREADEGDVKAFNSLVCCKSQAELGTEPASPPLPFNLSSLLFRGQGECHCLVSKPPP